jgi:hypothetical protein
VLMTIGIMRRVRRAFETFDDPDRDLAHFIESRVFHRYDQFLVSWSIGIEPYAYSGIEPKPSARLARHSKTLIVQGCWVLSPFGYSDFSQIVISYVLFSLMAHCLTTPAYETVRSEFLNANRVMRPSQSVFD